MPHSARKLENREKESKAKPLIGYERESALQRAELESKLIQAEADTRRNHFRLEEDGLSSLLLSTVRETVG
jgi:hypothetical protein